ncbi:hypothetical protein [Azospirillum picis]|uniref:Uncharacterized protein n=1 Tax=Azospirillum picis TaxID=488438 RepID=A0ABU0MT06_9PROT|nr:hypothetical protein [Azospirillum picis]MBP2302865.1 hypothetical protein [Azospirillum picis]MDQ0536630.1 hypothetical protein [Azospirillum picis]
MHPGLDTTHRPAAVDPAAARLPTAHQRCDAVAAAALRLPVGMVERGLQVEQRAADAVRLLVADRSDRQLKSGTVTFTRTKSSLPRSVNLEPSLVQLLEGRPRFLNSEFVFWHDDGRRYLNVSVRFEQIVRPAKESA